MAKRTDGRTKHGTFRKGVSGNPAGVKKKDGSMVPAVRKDDWQNRSTGLGMFGRDKRVGTEFNIQTLSFDQLKDLWLGDDLASRAVETIPGESLRQGYDLVIGSSGDQDDDSDGDAMTPTEQVAEIRQKLELLNADDKLKICGSYERGYGGAALLIGANDGQEDLTKPLNLDAVRSIDWLTPLEAREIMPLYAYGDPRAPKYGDPEIYQLMSRAVLPTYNGNYYSSTMLVHESRLIPFPGIRVSRYQVTTMRGGWGEAVLSRIHRVLRDFNTAWASAGVLVSDFAQSVIKVTGLWEALALDGGQTFEKRLQAMELGRSVVNAVTIDATDSYERQQTPLAGLPDLLERFATRLAAACDMPLTLLFGTSPAGMNATGDSDIRFFYDRVASYQQSKIEPALRRLCQVIFRTIGNRKEPDNWSIKFRPLWQESAKDKAAAMFTQAQADNIWIQAQVISAEEVASSHWGSGEYNPNLSIDFKSRENQELAAEPTFTAEDREALDPDYVPPPPPGSATLPAPVPAPGPAAAPDPNTPTTPSVTAGQVDRADAVLTAATRNKLPDSKFAYPEANKLPIHDRKHVLAAMSRFSGTIFSDKHPGARGRAVRAIVAAAKRFKIDPSGFEKKYDRTDMEEVPLHVDEPRVLTAADMVVNQLSDDFPPEALAWVRTAHWIGPAQVPLDEIDFSNAGSWRASKEPDKVAKFEKRILGGWTKPIILVKRPGHDTMMIADGHHRALAYLAARMPAMAFVCEVASENGPWDEFHDSQHEEEKVGGGKQDARDERARFAGTGYGMPSPEQTVARRGHARMAAECAQSANDHAEKASDYHARAVAAADGGDWATYADLTKKGIAHQNQAFELKSRALGHTERASGVRADAWSDEAREAAAEARSKNGSAQSESASAASANANEKNTRSAHEKAAEAHSKAAAGARAAGNQEAAAAHEKASAAHEKAATEAKTTSKSPDPKASDQVEHGGHGEGGSKSEEKHPSGSEGKHGGGSEKGEGGKEGKESKGKEKSLGIGKAIATAKAVGGTVAGEKAAEVAGQVPGSGGGEGGEE